MGSGHAVGEAADPILAGAAPPQGHLHRPRHPRVLLLEALKYSASTANEHSVVPKSVASGSAEVGYWTAAQARGRGVAPRALEALTAWSLDAFRADGLERL